MKHEPRARYKIQGSKPRYDDDGAPPPPPLSRSVGDPFADDGGAEGAEEGEAAPPPRSSTPGLPLPPGSAALLCVSVSDPATQGEGVHAHTTYRVSTTTNMPEFKWGHFSVARRFRDFAALHAKLSASHPGAVVPPLPEKRFAARLLALPAFVAERCASLDAFAKRLAGHPTLRASPLLRSFLEGSDAAWAAALARPTPGLTLAAARAEAGAGLLGGLAALAAAARAAAHAVAAPQPAAAHAQAGGGAEAGGDGGGGGGGGGGGVAAPPPSSSAEEAESARLKAYYADLGDRLADCAACAERLVRRQAKLGQALAEFGGAAKELSACPAAGGAFSSAGAAAAAAPAASPLALLGNCCVALGSRQADAAAGLKSALEAPVRDMARGLAGVRAALAARAAAAAEAARCAADVAARRARVARLRSNAASANANAASAPADALRLAAEERDLAAAGLRAERAAGERAAVGATCASELLRSDADRAAALAAVGRAVGEAQRALAEDGAKAFRLMGVGLGGGGA